MEEDKKSSGQVAFEAYRDSLGVHHLGGNALATSHAQPWGSVDQRTQIAWEASAEAVKKSAEKPSEQ